MEGHLEDHDHTDLPHPDGIDRRRFLHLMGASLALAGGVSCTRQPTEKIVAYVKKPEELVEGEELTYATALSLRGLAMGVLVESHTGRPTKIEGNPLHPASLGATDAFTQAAILSLYDPERSQAVMDRGQVSSWPAFLLALATALEAERGRQGAGVRILTETVTSPTLASQLDAFLAKWPRARWHQWEPAGRDNAREGSRTAFGGDFETLHRFDRADVVLSLDADFLHGMPGAVRHARDLSERRRGDIAPGRWSRIYALECTPSLTGAAADHRLSLAPAALERFARTLARRLGVTTIEGEDAPPAGVPEKWLGALVEDLERSRGASIVVAGGEQPPHLHVLAHIMNQALGNAGKTVIHTAAVEARPVNQLQSLADLSRDLDQGAVDLLVILGGNPVHTGPADLRFAERLARARLRVHLALEEDETSSLCHWHVPEAHPLEAWSDVRSLDGTLSIVQPLIEPLHGGKSAHEILRVLLEGPGVGGYEIVREHWKQRLGESGFEKAWRRALHDGLLAGSASKEEAPRLRQNLTLPPPPAGEKAAAGEVEVDVLFRPDPTIFDGRFAGNAWLQELPKPLTHITWDNAALVSPALAERLEVQSGDVVEISRGGRRVEAPVWVLPGQPDGVVTLHFGHGRTRAGKLGTGTGFDAYRIRTMDSLWHAKGVSIARTGERAVLATTQNHHRMEGRDLVRSMTVAERSARPAAPLHGSHGPAHEASFYPEGPRGREEEHAWGMVIDLAGCTGCGACVVACQAENNIPVVGKDQVARGREMHWIRIDVYHEGSPASPTTHHQPVPCMHCEAAPCEVVCPVGATVHGNEGLNEMVYNRCVGTRYCSNNCPYKVRRFNYYAYSDVATPSLKLLRNPDVTVRTRGVMEKCTYCVQRINEARIDARIEGRRLGGDDVKTACQAVCPSRAIVFGDLKDPSSQVAKLKESPLNYALLGELQTRPRTTYLSKLRNPNPGIEAAG